MHNVCRNCLSTQRQCASAFSAHLWMLRRSLLDHPALAELLLHSVQAARHRQQPLRRKRSKGTAISVPPEQTAQLGGAVKAYRSGLGSRPFREPQPPSALLEVVRHGGSQRHGVNSSVPSAYRPSPAQASPGSSSPALQQRNLQQARGLQPMQGNSCLVSYKAA